jgi:hypothetical protein
LKFYHYTPQRKLESILRYGLKPEKSEKGFTFLWDSLNLAVDNCGVLAGSNPARSRPVKVAILEVVIPKSWTRPDDGYSQAEAGYGHSFKLKRRVSPERLTLVDADRIRDVL